MLFSLLQSFVTYAEQGAQSPVKGRVVDGQNVPLPGVSIVIKGTTLGTTTDANGEYFIEVTNANAVLIFSFIGFESNEIIVGERQTINVTLKESATELDEMVVVGYGQQKKKALSQHYQPLRQPA